MPLDADCKQLPTSAPANHTPTAASSTAPPYKHTPVGEFCATDTGIKGSQTKKLETAPQMAPPSPHTPPYLLQRHGTRTLSSLDPTTVTWSRKGLGSVSLKINNQHTLSLQPTVISGSSTTISQPTITTYPSSRTKNVRTLPRGMTKLVSTSNRDVTPLNDANDAAEVRCCYDALERDPPITGCATRVGQRVKH